MSSVTWIVSRCPGSADCAESQREKGEEIEAKGLSEIETLTHTHSLHTHTHIRSPHILSLSLSVHPHILSISSHTLSTHSLYTHTRTHTHSVRNEWASLWCDDGQGRGLLLARKRLLIAAFDCFQYRAWQRTYVVRTRRRRHNVRTACTERQSKGSGEEVGVGTGVGECALKETRRVPEQRVDHSLARVHRGRTRQRCRCRGRTALVTHSHSISVSSKDDVSSVRRQVFFLIRFGEPDSGKNA